MQIDIRDIIPTRDEVLQGQGYPRHAPVKDHVQDILTESMFIFNDTARPQGINMEISVENFAEIYWGAGKNADDSPLQYIFPRAVNLAMFALTMGEGISLKIETCFKENNYALGNFLDAIATLAAENSVSLFEKYFQKEISGNIRSAEDIAVLSYSPGYCGWHISCQQQLFKFLNPISIGIHLNESFLMTPIKSVTGVLLACKKEHHIFKTNFVFCKDCKNRSCLERMRKLKNL